MHAAQVDLNLERLWVVYPGSREYNLDDATVVVPLGSMPQLVDEWNAI